MHDLLLLLGLIVGAILIRIGLKQPPSRSRWRYGSRPGAGTFPPRGRERLHDASDHLRLVTEAAFERRRLLSKKEAEVFHWAEQAVEATGRPWRVMAQVCLGEILQSSDTQAFRAINSKRVDLLIVCNKSLPVAAIEYQGRGHHQGNAPARDAVKKEALRKAGVRYIEVTPEHDLTDVMREISRLAKMDELRPAA